MSLSQAQIFSKVSLSWQVYEKYILLKTMSHNGVHIYHLNNEILNLDSVGFLELNTGKLFVSNMVLMVHLYQTTFFKSDTLNNK